MLKGCGWGRRPSSGRAIGFSHLGESIAQNAGLADWIAENDDDYATKAATRAVDLEDLAGLRASLRERVLASPLFDAPRFARHLEAALWGMWERWEKTARNQVPA